MKAKGFTLVELLVVLGVLAVLAVIVVLILEPSRIFEQARDARRIEDMRAVANAIRLGSLVNLDKGDELVVYISLPDENSSSCDSFLLPQLDAPFTYRCVPRNVVMEKDGSGWIPINFFPLEDEIGATLSSLPLDPLNVARGGLYYTYSVYDGHWKITARLESTRYAPIASGDGGIDAMLYEVGSRSKVEPSLER